MSQTSALEPALPAKLSLRDEPLYEVVDGQRVELVPMGVYEIYVTNRVDHFLEVFAIARQLGRVVQEMLFALTALNRQRRPDVAFVSYQRWPRNRPMPRGAPAWEVVPELAVEVISPRNKANEVMTKVQEYFRAGVQLVWVIWPPIQQVYVYESPTQVRILTAADELAGDPVLPGFRLSVASLFEEEETSAASEPGTTPS